MWHSDYRPTDDSDEGSSCEEDLGLGERRRPELLEEYDDEEYTEEDAEGEFDDEDDDAYEARVQAYLREVQAC